MVWLLGLLSMARSWTSWSWWIPSHSNIPDMLPTQHILWFYDFIACIKNISNKFTCLSLKAISGHAQCHLAGSILWKHIVFFWLEDDCFVRSFTSYLWSGFKWHFSEDFLQQLYCFLSVKWGFLTSVSPNYWEWKTRFFPQAYKKPLEQDSTAVHVSTCITTVVFLIICWLLSIGFPEETG